MTRAEEIALALALAVALGCSAAQLPPGTSATVTGPDGLSASAHGAWIPNPAPTTINNFYGCPANDAGRE